MDGNSLRLNKTKAKGSSGAWRHQLRTAGFTSKTNKQGSQSWITDPTAAAATTDTGPTSQSQKDSAGKMMEKGSQGPELWRAQQ